MTDSTSVEGELASGETTDGKLAGGGVTDEGASSDISAHGGFTGDDEAQRLRAGYVARLGLDDDALAGLRAGDDAALEALVAAHVAAVPFENVRVMTGEGIRTEVAGALRRIVDDGAGGLCFELNAALAWLLGDLGLETRLWAAAVRQGDPAVWETEPERWGIDGGHVFIEVTTPSGPRLVDVGFGGEGFFEGLPDAHGRVTTATGRQYRAQGPVDAIGAFAPAAAWLATSPDSRFTGSLVISRAGADATRTLAGVPDDAATSAAGAAHERFTSAEAPDGAATRMHPLAFTAIVTPITGERERRQLSYEEAQRFAREQLAFAAPLPRSRVVVEAVAVAPEPAPVHRTGSGSV